MCSDEYDFGEDEYQHLLYLNLFPLLEAPWWFGMDLAGLAWP